MEKDLSRDIFMLVDGSAIVHRAYHALPHFASSKGNPTGAVHGFFSMLFKVMQNLSPNRVAIAFDRPKPTFRQLMYAGYQAQRPKMEGELSSQFKMIGDILSNAKIATYAVDGFEADDVLGTLNYYSNKHGIFTYIVTGDRDILQLVDKDTRILMPIKGISEVSVFDADKVREKYGINPEQIVELKALMGDASDNYPGVRGIGPKTASNLINEFETIENIYKNIDKIASKNKKLAQKLIDGHDDCIMSLKLAKIVTDVPFSFDIKDCSLSNIDVIALKKSFEKYDFKTLPKRVDEVFGLNGKLNKVEKANQMKLL